MRDYAVSAVRVVALAEVPQRFAQDPVPLSRQVQLLRSRLRPRQEVGDATIRIAYLVPRRMRLPTVSVTCPAC
jgi:hypothetical protein